MILDKKNKPAKTTAQNAANDGEAENKMALGRKNYILILIGAGLIVLGFILMSGSVNNDPDVFNEAIFSFRRITLAPILVLAGFVLEIVAIMKRFDKKGQ